MHCHGLFKGLLFNVIDTPVACVDICEVLCQEAIVVQYRIVFTQCTQFLLTTLDMHTLSMKLCLVRMFVTILLFCCNHFVLHLQ